MTKESSMTIAQEIDAMVELLTCIDTGSVAWNTAIGKAGALLLKLKSALEQSERQTDEELMRTVINECDTLDITRVHEQRNGSWHATTIFDGDAALLRVVRAALASDGKGK